MDYSAPRQFCVSFHSCLHLNANSIRILSLTIPLFPLLFLSFPYSLFFSFSSSLFLSFFSLPPYLLFHLFFLPLLFPHLLFPPPPPFTSLPPSHLGIHTDDAERVPAARVFCGSSARGVHLASRLLRRERGLRCLPDSACAAETRL